MGRWNWRDLLPGLLRYAKGTSKRLSRRLDAWADQWGYHLRFCGFMPVMLDLVAVVVVIMLAVRYL